MIGHKSIVFWEEVRGAALDSEAGRRLAITERLYAELARRFTTQEMLRATDGRGLFVLAVAQGWAVPEEITPVISSPILRITLVPDGARVWHTESYHERVALTYWNGHWGVGFSSLVEELDSHAINDATNAGLTEDEYVARLARLVVERLARQ